MSATSTTLLVKIGMKPNQFPEVSVTVKTWRDGHDMDLPASELQSTIAEVMQDLGADPTLRRFDMARRLYGANEERWLEEDLLRTHAALERERERREKAEHDAVAARCAEANARSDAAAANSRLQRIKSRVESERAFRAQVEQERAIDDGQRRAVQQALMVANIAKDQLVEQLEETKERLRTQKRRTNLATGLAAFAFACMVALGAVYLGPKVLAVPFALFVSGFYKLLTWK